MTQKKSPAHTGPTTQTSDNSDNLIIADCLEFLKALYPERTIGDGMEAFLEVRFLQPGTVPETKFISIVEISPETVRKLIEKGERARKNVYFGVGARNKKAGKKEDIGYISTAWLDIDEKDGISKGEAVKLLREWQHKPSYIIDSGHGIHAYWFLREPIFEPPEFKRLEIVNKALAQHFNGDKQVSNYAQPMRLPGSLNVKREPFLPVQILEKNPTSYELEDLEEALSGEIASLGPEKDRAREYKLTGERPGNGKGITPGSFKPETIEKVIEECAFLTYCQEDSRTLGEAPWYQMITNLAALGADEKIHELSSPYANYTRAETDEKIKHAREALKRFGPHSCQTIGEDFKGCLDCNWREKVKAPAGIAYKLERRIEPEPISEPVDGAEASRFTIKPSEVGLTVLGFNSKGEIVLWLDGAIITQPIKELNRLKLNMLTGRAMSTDEAGILRENIVNEAGKKRLVNDSKILRNGIWRLEGDFYIISGKDVLKITDKVERIDHPVVCGRIVEYEESWLDPDLFETTYENPPNLLDVYNDLHSYVDKWNWKDSEMPGVMTAFLMVAPFQKLMSWRPWIYIIGRRETGKSLFFEKVIEQLYGDLASRLDKATAYATIQELEGTGKIPLFDEFEKDRKISSLLSTIKVSNRSGVITRGTPGKKNRKMKIDHIFWFNSILNSLEDAASDTRTVIFRLNKIKDTITFWTKIEAQRTLVNILVSVIRRWKEIEIEAQRYSDTAMDRRVENIAYAVALQAIATGRDVSNEMPHFAVSYENIREDESILFAAIMDTLTYSDTHTVKQDEPLRTVRDLLLNEESLESKGLKYVKTIKYGERLALRPDQVKRYLLKDTDFYKYDITELLGNMDGAIKPSQETRQKFNGATAQCFLIPWEYVSGEYTSGGEPH